MTPKERRQPAIIDGSRRRRIAGGSGVQVQDVNRLLKQFMEMQRVMKSMKGGKLRQLMSAPERRRGRPPGVLRTVRLPPEPKLLKIRRSSSFRSHERHVESALFLGRVSSGLVPNESI